MKVFKSIFLVLCFVHACGFAEGEVDFFRACLNGDAKAFFKLYEKEGKKMLYIRDKEGNTPLHLACCSKKGGNKKELVSFLVEQGANINVQNGRQSTPLIIAVSNGNIEATEILLKLKDIKINQATAQGFTPLHIAVINRSIPLIEILLAHPDINPNFGTTDGATPLHYAAMQEMLEEAKLLIDHPLTNVNAPQHDATYSGATPLHFAAMQAQVEIVDYLIKHGAKVSVAINKGACGGFTPLHFAVLNPDSVNVFETVKMLIRSGANPKTKCHLGKTPTDLTSVEIIQELLKNPKKLFNPG